MVNNRKRPVQFVFAGKAHPKDSPASGCFTDRHAMARCRSFRQICLYRDYDINVVRRLRAGVDVGLTSAVLRMLRHQRPEVVLNGGLHLSCPTVGGAEALRRHDVFAHRYCQQPPTPRFTTARDGEDLHRTLREESPSL